MCVYIFINIHAHSRTLLELVHVALQNQEDICCPDELKKGFLFYFVIKVGMKITLDTEINIVPI